MYLIYIYFIYVFAYIYIMCLDTKLQHSHKFIQDMDILLSYAETTSYIMKACVDFCVSWVLRCPQGLYFLLPNIVAWKILQNTVALEQF